MRKNNLKEMQVVIRDIDKKIFSIHQGIMESSIMKDVNNLKEQGRNIQCNTLPANLAILERGFRQVEDVRRI